MLQKMITKQLDEFKHSGGFTEGLSKVRVATQTQESLEQGAPTCPVCGRPMIRRSIKRGSKAGRQFWGCSGYPECQATLNT